MATRGMTIGELARAAGVGVETIRYYQRLGLLRQPAATRGGRRYDAAEVTRLRYIRNAKALRLSLKDIASLQEQLVAGPAFCAAVRGLVATRRAEVDQEITELTAARSALDDFLVRCAARDPGTPCPVAADLAPLSAPRPDQAGSSNSSAHSTA